MLSIDAVHDSGTLAALEDLAKQLEQAAAETTESDDKPKQAVHLPQEDDARLKRRKRYKHKS